MKLSRHAAALARTLGLALLPLVASIAAGGLAGCDGSASGSGAGVQNASAGSTPPYLDRMASAPTTVAYGGKRRVRVDYPVEGGSTVLDYQEDVYSDGQGRFAIVPGEVARPRMTSEQLDLFTTLQQARDGFLYRYRDFRIRDVALFLQNWRVVDTGRQAVVAGVTTNELEFRRIDGAPITYRAWIDPQTALVMRSEERDGTGRIVSSTEFLTFQLAPDLTGIPVQGDQFLRTPFDASTDTVPQIGFRVRAPTVLPEGYRLERAESTSDGTDPWAILSYTDGVDSLFFLQSPQPSSSTGPTSSASLASKIARGFRIGPWTVLQVDTDLDRTIVLGKADALSIERTMKSAVH